MRVSPMNPAELDNLEGAATPITVDRLLGRPLSPEEQESRGYADDLVRQAAAIMQGNPHMTREEAMTLASRAGVDARAAQRATQRDAERQAAMPRGDSFDESYGNPVVMNPAGMTAPGPRDPFTGEAAPPSVLATQRDVDAYTFRTPRAEATQEQMMQEAELGDDETPYRAGGPMLPSQEDRDMWERGLVRVVNPMTGEPAYRLASTGSPIDLPGAAGRRGYRPGLEGKYEPQLMDSPTGRVKVLVPTQAFRQQNQQREDDQRLERLADRAGISYDDAKAMLTDGRSLDDIRRMGTARLREDKRGRQAEVVRRAQARYNPTALLDDDWQQFVIASRLLGRQAGASPSDIALAEKQAAAAIAARNNQNTINVTPTMQAAADQARMDSQAAIVQDAENYVNSEFAYDNQGFLGFFASDYTPEEQSATVTYLMNKYGPPNGQMTQQQAQQIVDGIAARKRKSGEGGGMPEPVQTPSGRRPGGTP